MTGACLSLTILAGCASPHKSVTIESFRVVKTTPESVDIEIDGSYGGSEVEICLDVFAKSRDGTVRSNGISIPVIHEGQKFRIHRKLERPRGPGKQQTDFLVVRVHPCGEETFLTQTFEWPYVWPEILSEGKSDKNLDLESIDPWYTIIYNMNDEDFFELDILMEKWNNPNERDKNGEWKLDRFRNGLFYLTQKNKWQEAVALTKKWRRFNRKSPGAAIVEANYWYSYAWHIRGRCTDCNDVDPVAFKVFRERMRRAEQILIDSKGYASNNPLWYETYLEIAIETKRDDKFIQNLFDEGIRKFPRYQKLYVVMSYQWTPLYGEKANWQKVEELANFAVNLTSNTDGTNNYAWIYVGISLQLRLENDIFQDSLVSWTKLRASLEDLTERYPSTENLNNFAAYACRAGDKEAYLKIRPKIQGHTTPEKWPSNYSIDLCDHRFMEYS